MSPPSSQLPYNPVRPRANVHSILKIFSLNRLRTLNHKFDTLFQLSAILLGYVIIVLPKLFNFAFGPNSLYATYRDISKNINLTHFSNFRPFSWVTYL